MKTYKYTCTIIINKNINFVYQVLTDDEMMLKWDTALVSIRYLNGKAFKVGQTRQLTYKMNSYPMTMKETIIDIQPPHHISQIYEVDQVWNRCDNHLTKQDNNTKWVMDVIFKFFDNNYPTQDILEAKTSHGMTIIKDFIENL